MGMDDPNGIEYERLAPGSPFSDPVELCDDTSVKFNIGTPHCLWSNNMAAASQLWQIDFVAVRTQINVVDTSEMGSSTVLGVIETWTESPWYLQDQEPRWNVFPRGITYITVKKWLGREVVAAVDDGGGVYVWRTLEIYNAAKCKDKTFRYLNVSPWFTTTVNDSAWGLDLHPFLPLIAISDNSSTITVVVVEKGERKTKSIEKILITDLGGNLPCISFLGDDSLECTFISYVSLTLDMLGGSFGVRKIEWPETITHHANYQVTEVNTTKIQQCGWLVKGLKRSMFRPVSTQYDLCGNKKGVEKVKDREFSYTVCEDVCDACWPYEFLRESVDRLGITGSWAQPQTWLRQQSKELDKWVNNGRRTALYGAEEQKFLSDWLMFVASTTQSFVISPTTGHCLTAALKVFSLPQSVLSSTFGIMALSICEFIEPLSLAIVLSRAATVVILRLTEYDGILGLRQELVLSDFDAVIVGLSVQPARAHDMDFELEQDTESIWARDYDVKDPDIGLVGIYLVRLHFDDCTVKTFLLSDRSDSSDSDSSF